jgi:DNA-nicking Smr family endonuclease
VRRSRPLSEQDRSLWAAFARHIKPLPGRAMPVAPLAPTITPPAAPVVAAAPAPRRPAPPEPVAIGTQPAGLDARRWKELRRGRLRPERTLDLHGRFAQEAHGAFHAFMAGAMADGLRCVCIITGKGSGEGGVLRRELPHWLNGPGLRGHVLAVAHPHRANTGSVHILLRRARV